MLGFLWLSDAIIALGAWALGHGLHAVGGDWGWLSVPSRSLDSLALPAVLSVALGLFVFSRLGLYEPKRTKSLLGEAYRLAQAVGLVWIVVYVATTFASPVGLSRATAGLALTAWLVLSELNRLLARAALRSFRRRGWNLRHAAIVGTGRLAQRLYHVLSHNRWTGIRVSYFIETDYTRGRLLEREVVGPLDAVDEIVLQRPVDIVFVALPGGRHEKIEQVLNRLARTNTDVRMVPDLLSVHLLRYDVTQLDELPIVSMTHSPQHGWNSVMKRAFDLTMALVAIFLLALPLAAIALAVKLTSKGSVFYLQERTSLGGRRFQIIKFRTMIENAETDTGPVWALPDDQRITRVGRLLRRTSLDELPQLFNVLLGHMSLVGPRPERPELVEGFRRLIPNYMLRSQVKAGLTGWAQVHGLRGQTSLRKRVQYDVHYITNWSFGLDVRILLLSLLRGFIHPNAR